MIVVDILITITVGIAGLLALAAGVFFGPFGVIFWFILFKNAEDAQQRQELSQVKGTLEDEVERQYKILKNRPD